MTLRAGIRLDLTTAQGRRQYERHRDGRDLAASIVFRVKERPEYPSTFVRRWELVNVSLMEPGAQADRQAVTPPWML